MMNLEYYFNPIRIKSENVLFLGCAHIGHDKPFILEPRGFKTVEESNEKFIERWNEVADENTIAFNLGDFLFGCSGKEGYLQILDRMNFKEIYCMPGNHCAGYKQLLKHCSDECNEGAWSPDAYKFENGKMVHLVPNYLEIIAGDGPGNDKMNIVLSHFPIVAFNGQGSGSCMLYSHCHNSLRHSELGRIYEDKCRVLEVSVERAIEINNGLPFSLKDIRRIMKNKQINSPSHHSGKTNNPF